MATKKRKTIEVRVLQRHIDEAEQSSTSTCAIAVALSEQFGLDMRQVRENKYDEDEEADYVSVDGEEIKVRKTNGFSFLFEWSKIPKKAMDFISKFDDDKKKVKPFTFRLPFFSNK